MMIDDQNDVPAEIPSGPLETTHFNNNPQGHHFFQFTTVLQPKKIVPTPAPTFPIPQTSPKDGCISAMDVSLT